MYLIHTVRHFTAWLSLLLRLSLSPTFGLRSKISQSFFATRCYASVAYAIMLGVSVCVSVCLSHSYILSKQIKVSSKLFHRRVTKPF